MDNNLSIIESIISYKFKNKSILKIALQHPSKKIFPNNYERLEFLGDSILGAIVSEWLFKDNNNDNEGDLTKKRSLLINKNKISMVAQSLKLIKYADIDNNIDLTIESTRDKISSDLYESVVGAIFLDSNYDNAKKFIKNSLLIKESLSLSTKNFNNKGDLNEFCHFKNFEQPVYKLIKKSGFEHRKIYKVSLLVKDIFFFGEGYRIKDAENLAAFNALKYFEFF